MRKLIIFAIALSMVLGIMVAPTSALAYDLYTVTSVDLDVQHFDDAPAGGTAVSATTTIQFTHGGSSDTEPGIRVTYTLIRDGVEVATVSKVLDIDLPDIANTIVDHENLTLDATPVAYVKVKVKVENLQQENNVIEQEKLAYVGNVATSISGLSPTKVTVGQTAGVQGQLLNAAGQPVSNADVYVYAPSGASVAHAVSASDGTFAMSVTFSEEGDYRVVSGIAEAIVKSRYNFTLIQPTAPVKSGQTITVQGKFTDSAGHGVAGLDIAIYDDEGNLVKDITSDTAADGSFIFRWTTGPIGVFHIGIQGDHRGHDYGQIIVEGVDFTVTANVSSVGGGVPYSQVVTITVKYGSEPVANTTLHLQVLNNDNVLIDTTQTTNSDGTMSISLPPNLDYGNVVIKVWGEFSGVWGQGQVSIPVVVPKPISISVTGLANPLQIRDYSVTVVARSNISTSINIPYVTVKVSGPAKTNLPDDGVIPNGGSFILSPEEYGNITLTVTATDSENNVVTEVFRYTVDAYIATVSPTEATVGTTGDIVVTVKDPSGTPVNNAVVHIIADRVGAFKVGGSSYTELTVDGTAVNIVGGVYKVQNVQFMKVAKVRVEVYSSTGVLKFKKDPAFEIKPVKDLIVKVSPDTILGGFSTEVAIGVRGSDGNPVNAMVKIYDPDGGLITSGAVTTSNPTITFTLLLDGGKTYKVEAMTTDEAHMGEALIHTVFVNATVKPDDGKLTAGEKEEITFELKNPINGNLVYADVVKLEAEGGVELITDGLLSKTHVSSGKFEITASMPVSATTPKVILVAKKNNKVIFKQEFAVIPPKIEVEPAQIYMGANEKITIKLTDAHGAPMAGRTISVYQGDTLIASLTTDENGQVVWMFSPRMSLPIVLKYGKYAESTINVMLDTNPPEIISIDPPNGATVSKSNITIHITVHDAETAVTDIYVNYSPVPVLEQSPTVTVDVPLTLKEGENTFIIVAKDKAGNVSPKLVYKLIYAKTGKEIELVVGSQFYKVNGKTQIMDVAPFIDPRYGRTLVPIRFIAEALGLNVEWNPDERTVLITGNLNGKDVQVKLFIGKHPKKIELVNPSTGVKYVVYEGLSKAEINGVVVDLTNYGGQNLGKPVIYNNRTMVPIRFVAEAFGAKVDWIPPATIIITVGEE